MAKYLPPFVFGTLATNENFIWCRQKTGLCWSNYCPPYINVMLISPRRWGKSSLVKKGRWANWLMHVITQEFVISTPLVLALNHRILSHLCQPSHSLCLSKMERWIEMQNKILDRCGTAGCNERPGDWLLGFLFLKFVPRERDKMAILQLPEIGLAAKEKGIRTFHRVSID